MTHPTLNDSFVQSFLSSLDCPRSLTVWLLYINKEHDQLLELDVMPDSFLNGLDFRDAYLATKFLSKANFLRPSWDKKKKALDSFKTAEDSCLKTNRNPNYDNGNNHPLFEYTHNACIRKIERILGDFCGDELMDCSNWGPGVTLKLKEDTSPQNKFRFENGITKAAYNFVRDWFPVAYPTWIIPTWEIQNGNKVVTVPKNSKTDRTIAVEPGVNLWFQKGIGSMIRRRLLRFGIDLNSQTRNQELARVGSKTQHLATIDFSSASDTISEATVWNLLPNKWFRILDIFRSKLGQLHGAPTFVYNKFSSMGNGFTFELESLIFFAIATSCCEALGIDHSEVSVFGDDVIIPVVAVELFTVICSTYGFSINTQKSFSTGYFRESCGEHYYNGIDCKPYFLKEEVKYESDVYKSANAVRRLSHRHGIFGCDKRFFRCWHNLYLAPSQGLVLLNKRGTKLKTKRLISEGYGDGGFIVNFDEATPSRCRHGIEGYLTVHRVEVPFRYESDDHSLLLSRLKGRSVDMSSGNNYSIRGRTRVAYKRLHVKQWVDLGPWF